MIDTDKYEGHTPGPWEAPHEILVSGLNHIGPLSNGQEEVNEVDAQLIADAPLLLEEVKRLRDAMEQAIGYVVEDYYVLKVLCKALGKQLNPIQELMGDDARGEEE